jgi:hypothetical protein
MPYVIVDNRPRYIVIDLRGTDPECGHHTSRADAYEDLAGKIVFRSRRYDDLSTDEATDRFMRVTERLARWLEWRDRAVERSDSSEGEER